jgi:ribonuclease-3
MQDLQHTIGYQFQDAELLQIALTHTSHQDAAYGEDDFERLEFLGDAVLGMVISEMLYRMFPQEREGDLAKRKAALVQRRALVKMAKIWGVDAVVRLSIREESAGGRHTDSTLEDACEALIGAVYLDGGFEAAQALILRHWEPEAANYKAPPKDPRTALQEWAQGRALPLPDYQELERRGEAHAPVFVIQVTVEGFDPVQAEGASKKSASAMAAREMLRMIRSQA